MGSPCEFLSVWPCVAGVRRCDLASTEWASFRCWCCPIHPGDALPAVPQPPLLCRFVFTSEPRIIALSTADGTVTWTADDFPSSTSFDFRGAFVDPPPVVDASTGRVYVAESYPIRLRGYSTANGQVLVRATNENYACGLLPVNPPHL